MGMERQCIHSLLQSVVPASGSARLGGVLPIKDLKVANRVSGKFNEVCHTCGESRQMPLSLAVSFPLSHPPNPGGWLPPHPPRRQGRASADRPRRPARPPPPSHSP